MTEGLDGTRFEINSKSPLVILIRTIIKNKKDELIGKWMKNLISRNNHANALFILSNTLLHVPLNLKFNPNGAFLWLYFETCPEIQISSEDAAESNLHHTFKDLFNNSKNITATYSNQLSMFVDMTDTVERMIYCIMKVSDEKNFFLWANMIDVMITNLMLSCNSPKNIRLKDFFRKTLQAISINYQTNQT